MFGSDLTAGDSNLVLHSIHEQGLSFIVGAVSRGGGVPDILQSAQSSRMRDPPSPPSSAHLPSGE